MPRKKRHRFTYSLVDWNVRLTVPENVQRQAMMAAARRKQTIEQLLSDMVTGTIVKGSIYSACNGWDFSDVCSLARQQEVASAQV